jgi:hypothetical protein
MFPKIRLWNGPLGCEECGGRYRYKFFAFSSRVEWIVQPDRVRVRSI